MVIYYYYYFNRYTLMFMVNSIIEWFIYIIVTINLYIIIIIIIIQLIDINIIENSSLKGLVLQWDVSSS